MKQCFKGEAEAYSEGQGEALRGLPNTSVGMAVSEDTGGPSCRVARVGGPSSRAGVAGASNAQPAG